MKDNPQYRREPCFQSDEVMDSILETWYRTEQDGEQFWQAVSERIAGKAELNCAPEMESTESLPQPFQNNLLANVSWWQIASFAATVGVATFLYVLLLGLEKPDTTPNFVAEHQSPTRTAPPDSPIVPPAQSLTLESKSNSLTDIPFANELIEFSDLDGPNAVDRLTAKPAAKSHTDKAVAVSKDDKPAQKKSSMFIDEKSDDSNATQIARKSNSLDQSPDAEFPLPRYLRVAVEINKSGFGRVSVNGQVTAKRLTPDAIAHVLLNFEPELVKRMEVLGPRIGPVVGAIYVGQMDDGERIEFDSIGSFRGAIEVVANELPKIETKYKSRKFKYDPRDSASTINRANEVFRAWGKDALEMGGAPFRQRDPREKFARIIDKKSFQRFVKTGKFKLPGLAELYLESTTIQNLNSTNLRRRLVTAAQPVNLFTSSDEFKEFRKQMRDLRNKQPTKSVEPLTGILANRSDLQGLPLVMGDDCHLDEDRAHTMDRVSKSIGPVLSRFDAFSSRNPDGHPERRSALLTRHIENVKQLLPQSAYSTQKLLTVDQMLQIEQPELRLELVRLLGESKTRVSANLLSCYVKYDLEPKVRMAATKTLSKFPAEWYRPKLLDGLQYPWLEAAKHSAEAIVRLNDTGVVPELVELLNAPDPRKPKKTTEGHYVSRELVAINHLKNCMLCHADSQSSEDRGRAPVPEWGRPLPQLYYNANPSGLVARADVTYLRQDFSVVQKVENPGPWPKHQRFDYVVRENKLTSEEVERLEDLSLTGRYNEYRSIVVFALQMLTDQTPEDNSYRNWKTITENFHSVP